MEFWLDTIDTATIDAAVASFNIQGVTTNPTILSKSKNAIDDVIKQLLVVQPGLVAVQVTAADGAGMLAQAKRLAQLDSRIVVKVPATLAGYPVIKQLGQAGIPTMATAIFETSQYFLSMHAGATYAAPYLGKIESLGGDSLKVLKQMLDIAESNNGRTKILASSISTKKILLECASLGVPAITLPKSIYQLVVAENPDTLECLDAFYKNWDARPDTKNSELFK